MVWVKICRSIIVVFHCADRTICQIEGLKLLARSIVGHISTGKLPHCEEHPFKLRRVAKFQSIHATAGALIMIITIRTWSSHDHQCYLIIIRTWLSNIRWGAILITGSQHPPLSLHLRLRSDPDQKWVKSLFTNGGLVFPWWSIKARFFRAPNTLVQISTLASLLPTSRLLSSNNTHLTGELFWTRTRFTHF